MEDNFITGIQVFSSRNVRDLTIPLSREKRQHLIITGKNGSGKTSLLNNIYRSLGQISSNINECAQTRDTIQRLEDTIEGSKALHSLESEHRFAPNEPHLNAIRNSIEESMAQLQEHKSHLEFLIHTYGDLNIEFSTPYNLVAKSLREGFLTVMFEARRNPDIYVPKGINKLDVLPIAQNDRSNVNGNLLQFLVNLKAERSFARDDEQFDIVERIDKWFATFESRLREIFGAEELTLTFDRKEYNFNIITDGSDPFTFDKLSDGYSNVLSIISELIIRMEYAKVEDYTMEGVVVIDEIETHLHVDLQKKILPLLTDFFPNIQFIVSTHSPFILQSLPNAIVCDLHSRIIIEDLSMYSYDAIIESYFDSDKYSYEVKAKLLELQEIVGMTKTNPKQRQKLRYLKDYFAHAPKYLSDELMLKLQQIEYRESNKE
jgi:AAA15 family ATPase/GTPase